MPNERLADTTPRDRDGRRLWIRTESGEFLPVRSREDILKRGRGPGLPDRWVVARDPDWSPPGGTQGPARSLLAAGWDRDAADDTGGDADADTGFPGEGTKIGAGNKPQPYGWHGWYGTTGGRGLSGKGEVRGRASREHRGASKVSIPKKQTVNDANLRPEITRHYPTIQEVFAKHEVPLEITSANDSIHGENSLHYKNLAIDLKGNHASPETMQKIRDELSARLGKDYDVLFERQTNKENYHIHIEYDPKPKRSR